MTSQTSPPPDSEQRNPWIDKQLSIPGSLLVYERSDDEKAASAALQWEDVYDRRWNRKRSKAIWALVSGIAGLLIGLAIGLGLR